MNRLFFILFFLFGWTGTASTPGIEINMENRLVEFETGHLKSEYIRINTNVFNDQSLAIRNNNPGNLRDFKTGEFRIFNTLHEGYTALLHDLELKISGRSVWTDSTTTISDFIRIYAPAFENDVDNYIRIFCIETGLEATNLLKL